MGQSHAICPQSRLTPGRHSRTFGCIHAMSRHVTWLLIQQLFRIRSNRSRQESIFGFITMRLDPALIIVQPIDDQIDPRVRLKTLIQLAIYCVAIAWLYNYIDLSDTVYHLTDHCPDKWSLLLSAFYEQRSKENIWRKWPPLFPLFHEGANQHLSCSLSTSSDCGPNTRMCVCLGLLEPASFHGRLIMSKFVTISSLCPRRG